ncbi:Trigger factor, partial [Ananas comosus]
ILRLLLSSGRKLRDLSLTTFAVGSGLEASITDQKKKNDISLDNVKVAVESRDDEKIHVRVDLTAEETQKAFDEVLTNLARTAPPIPGFRRMKGGELAHFAQLLPVPKSFLLQILGKDRVTKFLIQEVVSTTIGDYVKKASIMRFLNSND